MDILFGTLLAAAYIGWYLRHRRHDHHELTTLKHDGFMTWNGTDKETARLVLGGDYVFLDYEYTIRGCSLSTWHRDITSGQRYWLTTHPTYTLIHYKYDGDFLSISPSSHTDFPYAFRRPVDIVGPADTMVLFNADMLHAGMPNTAGDARHAIQYKLAHRDDVARLAHLQGIHNVKEGRGQPAMAPWLETTLRHVSFFGSFVVNQFCPRLMMRSYDDGFANWIQRWIPLRFYINENTQ
jgi:hypothetical protein